jgi:hypothetical protein
MRGEAVKTARVPITLAPFACAVAAGLLTACPIVGHFTGTDTQDAFRADHVAKIERNRTTKRQIFEWFGPPPIIARRTAPDGRSVAQDNLAVFAGRQPITDQNIVYGYRNVRRTSSQTVGGVALPFAPIGAGGELAQSSSDQGQYLWILLDERTGLVQDYIVKGIRDP